MTEEKQSRFPVIFLAGMAVVGLLVLALYWLTKPGPQDAAGPAGQHLTMGKVENDYAEQIRVSDLRLSRAVNLLKHEFTYVNGVLANDGARVIRDIELVTEFRDQFDQIVLREVQRPFGTATKPGAPLLAGQRREFQLTFEGVPQDWNQQYPAIRVSGLVLE
jgi:hypothetical protein